MYAAPDPINKNAWFFPVESTFSQLGQYNSFQTSSNLDFYWMPSNTFNYAPPPEIPFPMDNSYLARANVSTNEVQSLECLTSTTLNLHDLMNTLQSRGVLNSSNMPLEASDLHSSVATTDRANMKSTLGHHINVPKSNNGRNNSELRRQFIMQSAESYQQSLIKRVTDYRQAESRSNQSEIFSSAQRTDSILAKYDLTNETCDSSKQTESHCDRLQGADNLQSYNVADSMINGDGKVSQRHNNDDWDLWKPISTILDREPIIDYSDPRQRRDNICDQQISPARSANCDSWSLKQTHMGDSTPTRPTNCCFDPVARNLSPPLVNHRIEALLKLADAAKTNIDQYKTELVEMKKQEKMLLCRRRSEDRHVQDKISKLLDMNADIQKHISRHIDDEETRLDRIAGALDLVKDSSRIPPYSPDMTDLTSNAAEQLTTSGQDQYVQYVDSGGHWCRWCHQQLRTIPDVLMHLHSKQHCDKVDYDHRPWCRQIEEHRRLPDAAVFTTSAKGVEMLVGCKAYYCSLCGVFCGDANEAEQHLKSGAHNDNYKKLLRQKPFYEKQLLLQRQISTQLSAQRTRSGSGTEPPTAARRRRSSSRPLLRRARLSPPSSSRCRRNSGRSPSHRRSSRKRSAPSRSPSSTSLSPSPPPYRCLIPPPKKPLILIGPMGGFKRQTIAPLSADVQNGTNAKSKSNACDGTATAETSGKETTIGASKETARSTTTSLLPRDTTLRATLRRESGASTGGPLSSQKPVRLTNKLRLPSFRVFR